MLKTMSHPNLRSDLFSHFTRWNNRKAAFDTLPTPIQARRRERTGGGRLTKATRPPAPLLPPTASTTTCENVDRKIAASPCPLSLTDVEVVEPISVGEPATLPGAHPPLLSSRSTPDRARARSPPRLFSSAARLGSNIIADWNCHRVRRSFAAGQNHSLIFGFNSHVNISLSLCARPIVIAASWPTAAPPAAPAP